MIPEEVHVQTMEPDQYIKQTMEPDQYIKQTIEPDKYICSDRMMLYIYSDVMVGDYVLCAGRPQTVVRGYLATSRGHCR